MQNFLIAAKIGHEKLMAMGGCYFDLFSTIYIDPHKASPFVMIWLLETYVARFPRKNLTLMI